MGNVNDTVVPTIGPQATAAGGNLFNRRMNQHAADEAYKKNIKRDDFVYQRSRTDALADWDRNNAYNSPMQQMQRLREAGLNPNLIYGKGADNTAAMVRSNEAPTSELMTVNQADVKNTLMEAAAMTKIAAETDNLYKQNALLQAQKLNVDANTSNTLTGEAKLAFDLELQKELRQTHIEREGLKNTEMKTDIRMKEKQITVLEQERLQKIAQNERNPQVKEQLEVAIANAQKDGRILEVIATLREKGLNPNDPTWMKYLTLWLLKKYDELPDWIKP